MWRAHKKERPICGLVKSLREYFQVRLLLQTALEEEGGQDSNSLGPSGVLGRGTGSKGKTDSALVYFLVENRLHILLILCCGGGFRFFFFFWLLLLVVVAVALRGGSSESLEEL